MATTDAKPGFRLPWGADRNEPSDAASPPNDGTTDHGDSLAADPTGPDQENVTKTMIDTAPTGSNQATQVSRSTGRPASPAADPVRKPNRLMADLARAMQGAAEAARTDTLSRFGQDAKAHIEGIHAGSATEATDLRKRADDDVAAIREWSKAEIARIRDETEQRITDRKLGLDGEIDQHSAAIQQRIERVQARVATFESEMAQFFDHLLAETDPTRLAGMAEALPEPPSFDDDDWAQTTSETVQHTTDEEAADAALPAADQDEPATAEAPDGDMDARLSALRRSPDFAAAEAEAAALGADDPDTDDEIPTIGDEALAARLAGLVPVSDDAASTTGPTRVIVTGLVSVASIAGFKRQLSRVQGIHSVGVSSGPEGEFIFAVEHGPQVSLRDVVPILQGFAARVTGEDETGLFVSARDPETGS